MFFEVSLYVPLLVSIIFFSFVMCSLQKQFPQIMKKFGTEKRLHSSLITGSA